MRLFAFYLGKVKTKLRNYKIGLVFTFSLVRERRWRSEQVSEI